MMNGGSSSVGHRPTGTITFVVTDVVDATRLWQQFPDQMAAALASHEQILRDVFAEHGGYDFGTAGNSFAIAFDDAVSAVRAAATIQQRLTAHDWEAAPIGVQIGLHSGLADERDGKYFGSSVNLAARIGALAGPGQVIMSRATHSLAAIDEASGLGSVALGEQRLKSFDEPHELFQLTGPGLSNEVTIRSDTPSTLPTPSTRFVGRERDVATVAELVVPGSLVTVSGMGGLGKTRIAIEAANARLDAFPDGVWWIDLVPLSPGAAGIALQVATTAGLTQQQGIDPIDSMVDGLARQTALLVLDNCEQLLGDVASVVDRIRRDCPAIAVLATSQASLGVSGEANVPLAPLDSESDALALLVERAKANDAHFDAGRWPRQDLVDLCNRLDGLPLAIEMAAARLRALSPREICDRLDDRFRMLKSRDRRAIDRHRSLLAALDWSYQLLHKDEQQVLDRLSIFAGSFDLGAAVRLCADDTLDEYDVLDLVSDLVDKSLVALVETPTATRYRLLETVRHYCDGHLSEADRTSLQRALVDHCVNLAEINHHKWLGEARADFDQAHAVFADDWNNFREAVRLAVGFDDHNACDIILTALWAFSFESFRNEIGDWARTALGLTTPPMVVLGACAMTATSTEEADDLITAALAMVDDSTPTAGGALCYSVRALTYYAKGDPACVDYARLGRFHARSLGPPEIAFFEANLAGMLIDQDDDEADRFAQSALAYVDKATNPMRAVCIPPLAWFEAKRGRPEVGYDLCTRGVAMCEGAGIFWAPTMALAYRARISMKFAVGDQRDALRHAIETGRDTRAWFAVWLAIGESVPWLNTHGYRDTAEVVQSYLDAKGIWYRKPDRTGHGVSTAGNGPTGQRRVMRRDELIDFVLAEIG